MNAIGLALKAKIPTKERLTRSALHYLGRYASSEKNLQQILTRKVEKTCSILELDPQDYAPVIQDVVANLASNGFINDTQYAETKVASLRRRGGSQRKIEAALSAKGVDRQIIRTAIEGDEKNEEEAALNFARRRRPGPFRANHEREKRREKDLAAMCRAGFSFELAKTIIDTSKAEQEE